MARTQLAIHPEILIWARERRGLDLSTAADKLDLAPERLADLERGREMPTPARVRAAAQLYRVSPGVFFLSEVPEQGFVPPKDLRTLGSQETSAFSPELREEIERVRSQQSFLRELATMGAFEATPVELPPNPRGTEDGAAQLRDWLRVDGLLRPRMQRAEILNAWIKAVERKGIYVSQVSGIPVAEMRGFCLPDDMFPMIVINGADSHAGRLFTLLHELIHVLLDEQCICNDPLDLGTTESQCNSIAAAMLMPRHVMMQNPAIASATSATKWTLPELDAIASDFGVSSEAVLRRLLTLGKTSASHYQKMRQLLYGIWQHKPSSASGGPSRDVLLLRNLGSTYVRRVISARNQGLITDSTVASATFAKVRWAKEMAARLDLPYL